MWLTTLLPVALRVPVHGGNGKHALVCPGAWRVTARRPCPQAGPCSTFCAHWGPQSRGSKARGCRREQSPKQAQRNGRSAIESAFVSMRLYIGRGQWSHIRRIRKECAWHGSGREYLESIADQKVRHPICKGERTLCDVDARGGVTWHALYGMLRCEDKIEANTASC